MSPRYAAAEKAGREGFPDAQYFSVAKNENENYTNFGGHYHSSPEPHIVANRLWLFH